MKSIESTGVRRGMDIEKILGNLPPISEQKPKPSGTFVYQQNLLSESLKVEMATQTVFLDFPSNQVEREYLGLSFDNICDIKDAYRDQLERICDALKTNTVISTSKDLNMHVRFKQFVEERLTLLEYYLLNFSSIVYCMHSEK